VILAFGPTISALESAGLNLTSAETEALKPIGTHNYFSSATKLSIPYGLSFSVKPANPALPPEAAGEPIRFLPLSPYDQIATSWSWGPYREYMSEGQARQILMDTLSTVNRDPNNATASSVEVTAQDVRAFKKWDYFPHYDSAQLKAGWYDKFNRLQGQNGTYFASGLNGFEMVERAVTAGIDVADSYFQ
jgi:hypothetical protein